MTKTLATLIEEKRREIEAAGLGQWEYRKPEDLAKPCPSCGGTMELVLASEGGRIEEPYFPTHPLRDAPLPRRSKPANFFACSSCENCEEL